MNSLTITIVPGRYNGTYSHARYTAWVGEALWDVDEGDAECANFWFGFVGICGKGDTALQAVADLLKQIP